MGKLFFQNLTADLKPEASLRAIGLSPGRKRWFAEVLVRVRSWSHRLGRYVKKTRVINRRDDYYFEDITDPQTGQTLHRCEEPLTEHRGHGDARPNQARS